MNKDNLEGTRRSATGQAENIVGAAMNDKTTVGQGHYDGPADKAGSAPRSAAAAVSGSVDAASAPDFSDLRDQITKLTQTVSDLTQKQVSAVRDQMVGAVGSAGDTLSQSGAVAKDKFVAIEDDVETRIKKNPWGAVAIAALIGLLIGKMT